MNQFINSWLSLNLSGALQIVDFIIQQAESQQLQLAIAVVDRAGTPLVRVKLDHAPEPSQEIALRKATTALPFNCATADWEQRFASASESVRKGLPLQKGVVFFGGGEPLTQGEQLVGGLGISGASEVKDSESARQASIHFKQLMRPSQ